MTSREVSDRSIPGPSVGKLPVYALRAVGVVAIAMAGLGLWYSTTTITTRFDSSTATPYLAPAVYTASAICTLVYIFLLIVGIQLVRLKTWWVRPFVGIVGFEIVLFFVPALLFFSRSAVTASIAAAAGLTLGGMVFQLVTLFVVWGPLLALWSKGRLEQPWAHTDPFAARERIARPSDWVWAGVNFLIILGLGLIALDLLWDQVRPGTTAPGGLKVIMLLISAYNAICAVRLRRERRRTKIEKRQRDRMAKGLCGRCEYDLTGNTSGICPECGERK